MTTATHTKTRAKGKAKIKTAGRKTGAKAKTSGADAAPAHSTISPPGSNRKSYYGQFSVSLTPLERMLVEYYADLYGKDRVEVIRGMLRKFAEIDGRFDPDHFAAWARKVFIPAETDDERRAMCEQQLATFRETSRARAAGKCARAS